MKYLFFVLFFFIPSFASAHVGYVLTPDQFSSQSGSDPLFILKTLSSPLFIIITTVALLLVVGLVLFCNKNAKFKIWKSRIYKHLDSYTEFLPWAVRLTLGIALIGAGTMGALISPIQPVGGFIPTLEILLGFFFLLGFLLVPTTITTIILFIIGITNNFYFFGNLDFLALALAYLALQNARPGLDDILSLKFLHNIRIPRKFFSLILRLGIGGAMTFLALYEKLLNPHLSELVVNQYSMTNIIPVSPAMWVVGAGLVELAVGLALLFGFYTRLVSVIAFLVLSLSFFYFNEAVYSHVTLFGLLSILFIQGGGIWSIDAWMQKRSNFVVQR
ncbi:MAG: DoxX family protein [bacterium]|nr:DoxX family protein [bacterium]